MSLAQHLLVRALLAWFWRTPYDEAPIRWGTRLHDRFLLPYYVEEDFRRVLARSAARRLSSCRRGLVRPVSRVPLSVYGRVAYDGVEIELRQAIEPWYVLGEEPGAGGTARYVDSSVERLQVRVTRTGARAVHGGVQRTPAAARTHRRGWRVRLRRSLSCVAAAALPAPDHPGAHAAASSIWSTPRARRSVGGCTYHVAHPGGRNYETFPVNSNEAESRRRARFFAIGHTPACIRWSRRRSRTPSSRPRWICVGRAADARYVHASRPRHGLGVPASRGTLGRMPRRGRAPAPALAPPGRRSASDGVRRIHASRRGCQAAHPGQRRHLQRLRRSAGQGASVADGPDSAS